MVTLEKPNFLSVKIDFSCVLFKAEIVEDISSIPKRILFCRFACVYINFFDPSTALTGGGGGQGVATISFIV